MLHSIVFFDWFWEFAAYLPFALSVVGGLLLGLGLFSSRGWQPTCRRCRHDLRGCTSTTCPECGADLDARGAVRAGRVQLRPLTLAIAMLCLGIAIATLPAFGFTPLWARTALAERLDPQDLIRTALGDGEPLAEQIHSARLVRQDPAYLDALFVECIRHFREDPLVASFDQYVETLSIMRAAPNFTPAIGKSIAASIRERVENGSVSAATATQMFGQMSKRVIDEGGMADELLRCDAIVAELGRLLVPNGALVGVPFCVNSTMSGSAFVGSVDPPRITTVRHRAEGVADWTTAADEASGSPRFSMPNARFLTLDTPGRYELEVNAVLRVSASDGTTREVPITHMLSVVVVGKDSVEITKVRGPEHREQIEAVLRRIKLNVDESGTLTASFALSNMPMRTGTGTRPAESATIRFGGTLRIGQSGEWHPFGTMTVVGGGGGMSAFSRESVIDPKRPFVVRIDPDLKTIAETSAEDCTTLDEAVELDFPSAGAKPTAIRWLDPSAEAVAPN